MTNETKGRTGWHQAASNTAKRDCYFTVITSRLKATIITLALWGWLPMCLANWISNRGGQHND